MLILLLLAILLRFYPLERIPKGSLLWHVRSGHWLTVSMDENARILLRKAQLYLPLGVDVVTYDAK
ncbi:MAG: hypothetical protein AAFV93_07380 [Chloroflexota bacterium]